MNKIIKHFPQTRIQLILIALLLHTIVPFFSSGFLHPDEQYYVLDFTFEKLNMIVNYQKSWEYLAAFRVQLMALKRLFQFLDYRHSGYIFQMTCSILALIKNRIHTGAIIDGIINIIVLAPD